MSKLSSSQLMSRLEHLSDELIYFTEELKEIKKLPNFTNVKEHRDRIEFLQKQIGLYNKEIESLNKELMGERSILTDILSIPRGIDFRGEESELDTKRDQRHKLMPKEAPPNKFIVNFGK